MQNLAIKSPCYFCDKWGCECFPDCADTCHDVNAYREHLGLPRYQETIVDPKLFSTKVNNQNGYVMCSYEEFKPVRKLLIKHKEKTHRTNKEIGMEIGISDFTVAGIIRGENQRTSMSVYEKIMAWAKLIK